MATFPIWLRLTKEDIKKLDALAKAENRTRAAQLKEIVEDAIREIQTPAPKAQSKGA